MYHEDSKSFLVFGKQLNQIITILQILLLLMQTGLTLRMKDGRKILMITLLV
mgnify:CR=1 FL=1